MGKYKNIETLFISGNNINFERRDMVRRSEVRVININNDINFTLHTYKFNNIRPKYDTKYMNWANVNCCGGWIYDEEYLINAVKNDTKLFACTGYDGEKFYKEGCVADYIDVENVINVYEQFGIILADNNKKHIRDMANEEIKSYVDTNNKFRFDYVNPCGIDEFIFNGMLLGYPIETTVHIIESFYI